MKKEIKKLESYNIGSTRIHLSRREWDGKFVVGRIEGLDFTGAKVLPSDTAGKITIKPQMFDLYTVALREYNRQVQELKSR